MLLISRFKVASLSLPPPGTRGRLPSGSRLAIRGLWLLVLLRLRMIGPHSAHTAPISPLLLRVCTFTQPSLATVSRTCQVPQWPLLTSPALRPSFEPRTQA